LGRGGGDFIPGARRDSGRIMNEDFGQLVDFMRGELDQPAAAAVRARLEEDAAFFAQFERLKQTYAVLRSLPYVPAGVRAFEAPGDFEAALRREFESRGWAALLPQIEGRREFLEALRAGFLVRSLVGSVPMLEPGRSFVEDLRRAFAVRALLSALPQLEPRPEFVSALRREFAPRAVAASLPQLTVRDGFKRRLRVALYEAAEVAAPPLPEVQPSDPFRRRLFKSVLLSSRRRVREQPRRADEREYQWGRELGRGLQRSRRSLFYTLGVHALAIVLMLFVVSRPLLLESDAYVLQGRGDDVPLPLFPTVQTSAGWQGEADDAEEMSGAGAQLLPEPESVGLGSELPPPEPDLDRAELPEPRRDSTSATTIREQTPLDVAGFFRLRTASRSSKTAYLGSEELHRALDAALGYLERTQRPDGAWGTVDVVARPADPALQQLQMLEITSAALLAFLGDGHSSLRSPVGYDRNVQQAVGWLLDQQHENGLIGPARLANVQAHAMATLALAEEFGMTRAPELRDPLRRAALWLCDVDQDGAFPFKLSDESSLTTGVWAYMALSTAETSGVPSSLLRQRRARFIDWYAGMTSFRRTGPLTDHSELLAGTLLPTSASAALSLFATDSELTTRSRAYLDEINRGKPDLTEKRTDRADMRYLFFGSLAMALDQRRGGTAHGPWQSELADTLIRNQQDDGSYTPASDYGALYGRVYATAMAALSIENAYRINPK
jgi:anti-sigma factor RsiW